MGASTTMTTILKNKEKAAKAAADEASGVPPPPPKWETKEERKERQRTEGVVRKVAGWLNGITLQTVLYLIFVYVFQSLAQCFRMPQEFYLDKHVMDRIVENHFDSSHNTFESVRRVADIWEWGNQVLWPGLLGDLGPCSDSLSRLAPKTCTDNAWPDGEGKFSLLGATPFSVEELVQRMDEFDWSEGIVLRQTRAIPGGADGCPGTDQLGVCYPELDINQVGDNADFGYNYTHPESPLDHPFGFFSTAELGSDPDGMVSAAIPSMKTYTTSGYIAAVIPFFSDTYLTLEEGDAADVTDYRNSYVNTTNGRTARFHCVRTSTNGRWMRQVCDPGANGDGTGRVTGLVRREIEVFWNDLKRAHWIDAQTRVVAIFLQLKSNHVGVRMRYTMMFELTALGAILPSYDVESRILDKRSTDSDMMLYASIALGMVILFCLLEFVEAFYEGINKYCADMWNVMDWANFIIFFMVYERIVAAKAAMDTRDCSSYMCTQVGFFDDYLAMGIVRQAKVYLSLCVCIQLFKVLKFAAQICPKTGLATAVMRKCALDLLFFGFTFVISMAAFSMMLYVQLGPVMEAYRDQIPAFISLFRALFGDFDIDEIMDNSSGYLNTLLFLGYLFIAIFIMLSMFLAILAEAQVKVRDDEAEAATNPEFREYGAFSHGYEACAAACKPLIDKLSGAPAMPRSAVVGEVAAVAKADVISATSSVVPTLSIVPTVTSGSVGAERVAAVEVIRDDGAAETNRAVLAAIYSLQAEVSQLRKQIGDSSVMPLNVPAVAL